MVGGGGWGVGWSMIRGKDERSGGGEGVGGYSFWKRIQTEARMA